MPGPFYDYFLILKLGYDAPCTTFNISLDLDAFVPEQNLLEDSKQGTR